MTTRLITAGAVLVIAIVFAFIFWNQFSSNQQTIAGNNPQVSTQTTPASSNTSAVAPTPAPQTAIPKNDNADSINADLNKVDVNGVDSDSSQFNTQMNGF